MLRLKAFDEITGADAGWLKAKHHFAIGPYGNPAHKPIGCEVLLFGTGRVVCIRRLVTRMAGDQQRC